MKKLLPVLLLGLCLALTGCPLQTDTPITGDTVVAVPEWLPGKWTELKDDKLGANTYLVKKIDTANSVSLSIVNLDAAGNPDPETMRVALVSTVKKQMFLSIYDKGDEKNSEGYYHYAISHARNGELNLVPLNEYLLASTTTGEELAQYIAQHAATSDYLDREVTEKFRKQADNPGRAR